MFGYSKLWMRVRMWSSRCDSKSLKIQWGYGQEPARLTEIAIHERANGCARERNETGCRQSKQYNYEAKEEERRYGGKSRLAIIRLLDSKRENKNRGYEDSDEKDRILTCAWSVYMLLGECVLFNGGPTLCGFASGTACPTRPCAPTWTRLRSRPSFQ